MLQQRYKIFEAFGIPIYVNLSFLLLVGIIALQRIENLSSGIAYALMLAISILLHELGHALTAGAFGYKTQSITLSLLGGCASMIALPRKAWQEFLTAIAGPLVSFVLALIGVQLFSFVLGVGYADGFGKMLDFAFGPGVKVGRNVNIWAMNTTATLATMNFMLCCFNLMPGFPLDGGRVFRSFMCNFVSRAQATYIAMVAGRVFAVAFAFFAVVYAGGWLVVDLMIAWMIWREGYREYRMARQEEDFSRWTQDDFNARVSPPPYER